MLGGHKMEDNKKSINTESYENEKINLLWIEREKNEGEYNGMYDSSAYQYGYRWND
jgi:hypothetical protein